MSWLHKFWVCESSLVLATPLEDCGALNFELPIQSVHRVSVACLALVMVESVFYYTTKFLKLANIAKFDLLYCIDQLREV